MGKSGSGKDTILKKLMQHKELGLNPITPYTTRPIRHGETEGVEYHFISMDEFDKFKLEDKIIEYRSYNTKHGIWNYATIDDGQIDLNRGNYLVIGTIEAYNNLVNYFKNIKQINEQVVVPLYIEIDEETRYQRALGRELEENNPKIEEFQRRLEADAIDFSEEKIKAAGITTRYPNIELDSCVNLIIKDIKKL